MLRLRRVPIDTHHENVAYLNRNCRAYDALSYLGPNRIEVVKDTRRVRAVVNLDEAGALVADDEIGLSSHAFEQLGVPEGAAVAIERAQPPSSRPALRAKIAGEELSGADLDAIVGDIVAGRYASREIAAFLVAASKSLTPAEVADLARARARHAAQLAWPQAMVVDKHSMGGVPGNRVTMIVVPIIAAHGLAIPKASSRAITSPAGTADAMEVLCRVDLSPEEVRAVVAACGGCIAWNGRLNHSPVDDVMNALTRPLGLDSARLAVASIMSKKAAAGSTHVAIDIPYGRMAKVSSAEEARDLAALFEAVGTRLGIRIVAHATDGSAPIGRGIGPALEARDVMSVLANEPDAPPDLRDKALKFAGHILEFDAAVPAGRGFARARQLLESGAALGKMDKIIESQGRNPDGIRIGRLSREIRAHRSGRVTAIDCYHIATIARRAGAPMDKGAGLDLFARIGDAVVAGAPLYRIHSDAQSDLDAAIAVATADSGYRFDGRG
jgi:thymidine phosphorylase